jgi:prophage antirepressor-like protein
MDTKLAIFKGRKIRKTIYQNEWWFSVVDVVGALTDSANPQVYWRVLIKRLLDEGSEQTVTNCNGLKKKNPNLLKVQCSAT